jgi:hypothetical protein
MTLVKSLYRYFFIKLFKKRSIFPFFPPSLSLASQSGGWIRHSETQFGIFSTCKSRWIQAPCGGGGGVAWVALWRAFPQNTGISF